VSLRGVMADNWVGWRTQGELHLDWYPNGSLSIRGGGDRTLTIGSEDLLLDDFITIRCLSTPLGDRLIVRISGMGTAWNPVPDNAAWFVIDPQQPVKPTDSLSRRTIRKVYGVRLNKYGDTIGVDPPNVSKLPNATGLSPPANDSK
jgi:hypothetical protein